MLVNEIITESASCGTTVAGGMAPSATALSMVSRQGGTLLSGKYSKDPTPNTPPEIKRAKKHASGRFKNSIGH